MWLPTSGSQPAVVFGQFAAHSHQAGASRILSGVCSCSAATVRHKALLLGTYIFGIRSVRSPACSSKARGPLCSSHKLCSPVCGSAISPLQEQFRIIIIVDKRCDCRSSCCSCSGGGQRWSSIVGSSTSLSSAIAAASGQRGTTRKHSAAAVECGPASASPQSWTSSSPGRNTAGRIAIINGGRFVAARYLCARRHLPPAHSFRITGGPQLCLRQPGGGGSTSGPQQLQSSGDTIASAASSHSDTHTVQPVWTAQSCPGSRQQTRGALCAHQHMVWG